MKQLGDLYHSSKLILDALKQSKPPSEAQLVEFEAMVKQAHDFLSDTKTFSYCGEFEQPHSLLKMPEIGMDLDDVVKSVVGKSTNVKFAGELYLIIYPEKADDKKVA